MDDEIKIEVVRPTSVVEPDEISKEIPTITFGCCGETYALSSDLLNYWEIEARHAQEHPECMCET